MDEGIYIDDLYFGWLVWYFELDIKSIWDMNGTQIVL